MSEVYTVEFNVMLYPEGTQCCYIDDNDEMCYIDQSKYICKPEQSDAVVDYFKETHEILEMTERIKNVRYEKTNFSILEDNIFMCEVTLYPGETDDDISGLTILPLDMQDVDYMFINRKIYTIDIDIVDIYQDYSKNNQHVEDDIEDESDEVEDNDSIS
jgi:hypothetical protein